MSRLRAFRFIWRAWRYRLRHDPTEVAFVRRHLRRGDTAIDIGAHKGAYTYWMARAVGRTGRVLAFEPQPSLAALLGERIADLALHHVSVEPVALSSGSGVVDLLVPGGGTSPGATVRPDAFDADCDRHPVRTCPLDEFLSERPGPPVRLIKCDVEGHELEVFRGAERTLAEDRPALLFECEQRHHPDGDIRGVFEFLAGLGYRGWFPAAGRLAPLAEFDPEVHQVVDREPYINNFIFRHESDAAE